MDLGDVITEQHTKDELGQLKDLRSLLLSRSLFPIHY